MTESNSEVKTNSRPRVCPLLVESPHFACVEHAQCPLLAHCVSTRTRTHTHTCNFSTKGGLEFSCTLYWKGRPINISMVSTSHVKLEWVRFWPKADFHSCIKWFEKYFQCQWSIPGFSRMTSQNLMPKPTADIESVCSWLEVRSWHGEYMHGVPPWHIVSKQTNKQTNKHTHTHRVIICFEKQRSVV